MSAYFCSELNQGTYSKPGRAFCGTKEGAAAFKTMCDGYRTYGGDTGILLKGIEKFLATVVSKTEYFSAAAAANKDDDQSSSSGYHGPSLSLAPPPKPL